MKISDLLTTKNLKRKKFFAYAGIGVAALFVLFRSPFRFFHPAAKGISDNGSSGAGNITININPYAVKRNPRGNNG